MLEKIGGWFHLAGFITENTFGLFPSWLSSPFLDKLYLCSFAALPISWILCKDECIISFVIKKLSNPKYQLGDEPENTQDLTELFPNKNAYLWFFHINQVLRVSSVVCVVVRQNYIIHFGVLFPSILLYILYVYDILYKQNIHRKYPYKLPLFIGMCACVASAAAAAH